MIADTPLDGFRFDNTTRPSHERTSIRFIFDGRNPNTRWDWPRHRKDGLGYVFTGFIGVVVPVDGIVKRPDVRVDTQLPQRIRCNYDYSGRPTRSRWSDSKRSLWDMTIWLWSILGPRKMRTGSSERRKHLEDIYKLLEPTHGHEMGYYVGEWSVREKKRSNVMRGWSWRRFRCRGRVRRPWLNCIILASPRSDVEQAWEIMRHPSGPLYPLIIDPYDPLFPGQHRRRGARIKRGYKLKRHARWRRWRIRVYTIYIKSKPLVCRILSDGFHFSPTVQNCKKSHTTFVFIPRSFQSVIIDNMDTSTDVSAFFQLAWCPCRIRWGRMFRLFDNPVMIGVCWRFLYRL
jgi:hypothetical protein